MKRLLNVLTAFCTFSSSSSILIGCMDYGKNVKKKNTKKIIISHDDNEEDEEDVLLALEMDEKTDKLSLISINVKTTANGINKVSDLIKELKTNKKITDITGKTEFTLSAVEEESELLLPLEYQLTIQLLKSDNSQTEEDNNNDDNQTEEDNNNNDNKTEEDNNDSDNKTTQNSLESKADQWITTIKVKVNNELSEEDKAQFDLIFTNIEKQLSESVKTFDPEKIKTVIDLEAQVHNVCLNVLKDYERFSLVKINNKSKIFKEEDSLLFRNSECINYNVILKTKYNEMPFEKLFHIDLNKWSSWDIIQGQSIYTMEKKLFSKITSLTSNSILALQDSIEKEIETLAANPPEGIKHPFTLEIWKQVCKLLALGIDPLTEEQLTSSDNDEIKMYSFAEWKYFKSILFQTVYFKDIEQLIKNFKNKLNNKADIVFKLQQRVEKEIYDYDQTKENNTSGKITVFNYKKNDKEVIYPKTKFFDLRLVTIIDGSDSSVEDIPWTNCGNLEWIEKCYFLPIALMWAVNNYFNVSSPQNETEEGQ